jgi:ATP-dependent Clp protease, protease subunit
VNAEPGTPFGLDPFDALLARRVVVASGVLDGPQASTLAATLLTLDATGDEHVELRLSSCRGDVDAALSVIDVMDVLGVPVHAVALGTVEGGPVGVLAAAERREIAAHATLRLRAPDVAVSGSAADVERALAAEGGRLARFYEVLAARTGRPFAEVEAEWARGPYVEAPDAVTLGYADAVCAPGRKGAPGG